MANAPTVSADSDDQAVEPTSCVSESIMIVVATTVVLAAVALVTVLTGIG